MLIVGGGFVALEKLTFLLKSSPDSKVKLVAKEYIPEVKQILSKYHLCNVRDAYHADYLDGIDVVIGATNDAEVNEQIYKDAKSKHILVNIADNPPLCDFYMGGIVTKGHLKIAISTNGQSPTIAKRLRQYFEEILPDTIDDLLIYLRRYRNQLKGDFETKVETLNKLTQSFIKN